MVGSSSVPPPRFARGTVLIARHSPRLEFLCKAHEVTRTKYNTRYHRNRLLRQNPNYFGLRPGKMMAYQSTGRALTKNGDWDGL